MRMNVGNAVKTLRQAAQDTGVPVIAVSQLNRVPESRDGSADRPRKHHLKESGAIEEHSDVILLVHRPCAELTTKQYNDRNDQGYPCEDTYAIVYVDKTRVGGGPTGEVVVGWDKSRGTFTDEVPPNVRQHLGRGGT